MALDLLEEVDDVKHKDKATYPNMLNQGQLEENKKDRETGEADEIWTANRHMHMKDLLEKIGNDFKKFRDANPQFADRYDDARVLEALAD